MYKHGVEVQTVFVEGEEEPVGISGNNMARAKVG